MNVYNKAIVNTLLHTIDVTEFLCEGSGQLCYTLLRARRKTEFSVLHTNKIFSSILPFSKPMRKAIS